MNPTTTPEPASTEMPLDPSRPFWLVWSPKGETPPRRRYGYRTQAKRAARKLAAEFGGEFFILRAEAVIDNEGEIRLEWPPKDASASSLPGQGSGFTAVIAAQALPARRAQGPASV